MGNPQSRKWNLVINNPQEYELTREIIIDRLNSLFQIIIAYPKKSL